MTNPTKKTSLLKIYNITALIAFIYSGLTIFFSVYKQFFYVDGTWFHGFTANGFAILSNVVWIGILIVFRAFLNKTLNYNKANFLIDTYLVFLSIGLYSTVSVVFKSIQIYMALDEAAQINSLAFFTSTSISSAILLILANIGTIVISILLGNRIRKINVILKDLFKILGFSLIVLGVFSAMQSLSIMNGEIVLFVLKAGMVAVLGYILKETYKMGYSLSASPESETSNDLNLSTVNPEVKFVPQNEFETVEEINILGTNNEIITKQETLPNFDSNELENKEMVLSYFENLSKDELSRLEVVVAKKYSQNLTDDQKKNLIIYHIAEKKLYDHDRYAPK